MSKKQVITCNWDMSSGVMTFGVEGIGQIKLDTSATTDDLREHAMFHGFEQKVRDAAAIPRNTKDGSSASPQEKFDAMQAVVENLAAGVWNVKAQRVPSLNRAALFEAIAEVRGVEASKVEAKFRDRQDDVLRAFLTHREIAAAYAKRTAKDNGAAEALFAELE